MIDRYLHRLDQLGAVIGIMNTKTDSLGTPNIVFLQGDLDQRCGEGVARVLLPITDHYVAHHGALGSYATIYVPASKNRLAVYI
jgi:hypothetical protein